MLQMLVTLPLLHVASVAPAGRPVAAQRAVVAWPIGAPGPVVRIGREAASHRGPEQQHYVVDGTCADRGQADAACAAQPGLCVHEQLALFALDHGLASARDALAYLGHYAVSRPAEEWPLTASASGYAATEKLRGSTYIELRARHEDLPALARTKDSLGSEHHVVYVGAGIVADRLALVPDPRTKQYSVYGLGERAFATGSACTCAQRGLLPQHPCWHTQLVSWLEAHMPGFIQECVDTQVRPARLYRRIVRRRSAA